MSNLIEALKIMVFGMTGIFVVLGLIYLSVLGLIKVFPGKDEQ